MDFLKSNVVKIFMVIVVVSVLIIIAFSIFSRKGSETADENLLINAAKRYFNEKKELLPSFDFDSSTVTLSTLVNSKYIKLKSGIQTCFSYVTVIKLKDEYIYNPYIRCSDDRDTKLLYDTVIKNVATTNDGLYRVNDEYIFKGENPNNYVRFSDELWRIVKLDENKNIKIMYVGDNYRTSVWDNRFNLETNNNIGINDYKVSRCYSYLQGYLNDDKNFSNVDRSKLAFVDLCIGKRALNDNTSNGESECSVKFEKQMIGLLQANEYINASNDINCSPTNTKVCQNYNFLARYDYWTITGVKDNTSAVFKISPRYGLKEEEPRSNETMLPVLFLRSDSVIKSGTGTESDPYVIR